jgi:murein DD-endopeptidase MepM/ murein hydrolase activator NlpD
MAGDVLADLTLRLQAQTAEFKQKLFGAGETVNKFGTKTKKQLRQAQKEFQASKKKISEGFSNMASGITGQLDQMTGGLSSLVGGAATSLKGVLGLSKGMNVFKVAMASTGIGLLVVALGSLVAYFTKTQRGSDLVSQAMAAVGAIVTTLTDTLSGLGEALVGVWNDPVKALKDFGAMIKAFVLSRFELLMEGVKGIGTAFKLLFEGEFKAAAKEAGKSLLNITRATNPVAWGVEAIGGAVDAIKKKYGEASAKAREAMKLEADSQKLEKDRVAWMEKAAKIELDMSELIRKSKEKENYTEAQRVEFIKQAQKLQAQLSSQKVAYAEEELRIKEGIDALGENMLEDDKKTAELRVQILNLKKEENDKTRKLVNRENEALNALRAKNKEQDKLNKAKKAELEHSAQITAQIVGTEVSGKGFSMPAVKMAIEVKPVEPSKLDAAKQAIVDNFRAAQQEMKALADRVSGMIQQSLSSAISGFAEAIGKGIAGDMSGLKGMFNSILGIVIDFGKQFGEMMIGIGLAKVSLEAIGISGIGAVIAGTALIALTTAASSFLSKGAEIPKFANGGIAPGGMALVGERGPELVNLAAGTQVTRANKTEQLLGQAQNVQVNIRGVIEGQQLRLVLDETDRRNGINF